MVIFGSMGRSLLFAFLLFIFAGLTASAQPFSITGTIIENGSSTPVPGVNIMLFKGRDTTNWTGAVTGVDGKFSFNNLEPSYYRIKTVFLGYEQIVKGVPLFNGNADLGTLQLKQSATALKGVEVEGLQSRVEQKGDTTQFNASSYKTNPDATAEDLVTKMPGITKENGTLKVNGEEVKKVTVDGKEFFGDDANAALRNLPAEVVDKIQVFDRMSDQSRFTGFDDGNTSKGLNIVTRPGMNNGQFGKVYAGYGTDDRYIAGASVNIFKGSRRFSVLGLSNNINQQNFSMEDIQGMTGRSGGGGGPMGRGGRGGMMPGGGMWRGGGDMGGFLVGQQGGITTTHAFGLNYSDDWGKDIKVSGSYFFNLADNDNSTELTRSFITASDSGLVYDENSVSTTRSNNHRFNFKFEYDIDSLSSIQLTPRVTFTDASSLSNVNGATITNEQVIESLTLNSTSSSSTNLSFSNDLLYRHKFAKKGRTFSANISTSINERNSEDDLRLTSTYYNTGSFDTLTVHQYQTSYQNTPSSTHSANLSFTEPVGAAGQLQLTYNPSYTDNRNDRKTYDVDDNALIDPPVADTLLSNVYESYYTAHRGGAEYRISTKKMTVSAGGNYQYAMLRGEQEFPRVFTVEKDFSNVLPQAMFNYRFTPTRNLRIHYRTSTNIPSISQLQDVIDNTNPLFLKTGNPQLRQNYSHSLMSRFGTTNKDKGTGFFFMVNGTYTTDHIANSTLIARRDTMLPSGIFLFRGTQLSQPVNLDGYVSARSFITFSKALAKLKCNLNFNTGFTYSSTPALINGAKNLANTYMASQGIVVASNISTKLDFTLSYFGNYNIAENTLQVQADNNYFSHMAFARVNWIFWKEFVVNTTLTHSLYSGLTESFNQDFLLWNGSLGYKFLKNKSLEVKVTVFDILAQNNSIARTVTETYIEDSQTRILQRYVMLNLTWNIRRFKAEKEKEKPAQEPAGKEN